MRAVVLSHRSVAAELGLLEPWLDALTHGRVERRHREDGAPDLAGDLLVVLGSPYSVAEGHVAPWAPAEVDAVRAWVAAGRPYLGICFGSQVLARALDGRVHRRAETFRAYDVLPLAEGAPAAMAGPWVSWHDDAVTAPAAGQVLAALPHADMAFRFGRAWGFQSHVEVDGDALERMLASIDVDPAEAEPIVAALRAAEESADPPKARVEALLDAFAADALG